jgi:hypothetical protein
MCDMPRTATLSISASIGFTYIFVGVRSVLSERLSAEGGDGRFYIGVFNVEYFPHERNPFE